MTDASGRIYAIEKEHGVSRMRSVLIALAASTVIWTVSIGAFLLITN